MSNIPVSSVSPVSPVNRPSSGRPSPSSSIYNGGSFEIIAGSSSSSSRQPLDFSYMNPFNNGQPGSMTDVTLEEALERVQDLMKENHELREYLKENNEMMKQQYKSLMEWKEKINQSNEFNSKKFEETRKLVESLQKENSEMKKKLEDKSADFQSERIKELERRNKGLEKNVSDKNSVIENLQEQLQNLQLQLSTGEKLETMLMIEKGNEKLDVGENLANSVKITQLENQVRQFRESNDQLLQDLENAQKLKEQFQKENASLCDQNIELSQKLEKVLGDLKNSKQDIRTSKQNLHDSDDLNREEERFQMQSRRSRSSESDVSLTDIKTNVASSQEFVNLQQRYQEQESLVQRLTAQIQRKDQQLVQHNKEESLAYTSDLHSLRSQVVSLLNEVTESQKKLEAASKTIEKKNTRISELEQKMQEQMLQNQNDGTVIETLRLSINNYQEAVNAERREHQATKKQLAEFRQSFNELVADYKLLNDELTKSKEKEAKEAKSHMENDNKRFLDEIGRLTAQTLAAEETIKYRDDQLRELQRENHNLRDNVQKYKDEADKVPILKAQAEVWKVDFDTERAARERQHTEKEKLLSDMHNLQVQNRQLLDELDTYSKGQFVEMQRRHVPGGGTHQQMLQGYLQVGGAAGSSAPLRYPYPQQNYPPQSPPGNQAQGGYDNQHHQPTGQQQRPGANQHEESEYQPLSCPKCDLQCPDVDTLQIHVLDCIDQPDT